MNALAESVVTIPGFRVVREPGYEWPDALIVFPAEPTREQVDTLRAVLTVRPALKNPRHRGPK